MNCFIYIVFQPKSNYFQYFLIFKYDFVIEHLKFSLFNSNAIQQD
jgi:hypothetical protein